MGDPTHEDVQGAEQLAEVIGALWQFSTRASRAVGGLPVLPPAQAEALHRVVLAGETIPTRLAIELRLSRPMVSELVGKLEGHQLVTRRRSTTDGRSVVLAPTERGRYVHEYFRRGVTDVFAEGLAGLSRKDAQRVIRELPTLQRLLEHVTGIAERSEVVTESDAQTA